MHPLSSLKIPCSTLLEGGKVDLPLIPNYLRIFHIFSMISDCIQNGIKLRINYLLCEIKTEQEIFREFSVLP